MPKQNRLRHYWKSSRTDRTWLEIDRDCLRLHWRRIPVVTASGRHVVWSARHRLLIGVYILLSHFKLDKNIAVEKGAMEQIVEEVIGRKPRQRLAPPGSVAVPSGWHCTHNYTRKSHCPVCSDCGHGCTRKGCKVCSDCGHGKLKGNCCICSDCGHGFLKRGCRICSDCGHGKLKPICSICKFGPRPK